MNLIERLFRKRNESASVAKERLQIVLAHERAGRAAPDFLPMLQREVLAVVAKYLEIEDQMIKIHLEKVGETSVLEINVELDDARVKSESAKLPVKEKTEAKSTKPDDKKAPPKSDKAGADAGRAEARRRSRLGASSL